MVITLCNDYETSKFRSDHMRRKLQDTEILLEILSNLFPHLKILIPACNSLRTPVSIICKRSPPPHVNNNIVYTLSSSFHSVLLLKTLPPITISIVSVHLSII